MKKHLQGFSWSRLLLWSHVISVISLYLILWRRGSPGHKHKVSVVKGPPSAGSPKGKSVSIIVPARNEERNIHRCVTSLLEQDYENYEVIVVDDGSSDGTAAILDDIAQQHPHGNRLWILHLRNLPEGWAGKPHALHRGVQESQGEWLLFTDADTWHTPAALRSTMTEAINECSDLFSLGTGQETPDFWDKVMMPIAYTGIIMQYPVMKVNDSTSPIALANGQYILMRRHVYDIVGGYARPELRHTVLDDRDLARIVKENGFRLRLVDGQHLVRTHMYRGLGETWRGWRKNAFLGSRGGVPFMLLMLIGIPAGTIAPFLLPLFAWPRKARARTRGRAIGSPEFMLASVLELLPLLGYRVWANKILEVPWYYAFTHPLGSALFEGILAQSAWRVLTHKGIDWRGRQYYST